MRLSTLLATLLVAPLAAAAQDLPLQPGQRVRVTVQGRDVNKQQTTFQRIAGDTLVLSSASYALADVMRIDVYLGRRSNAGKGALIGALVGTGLGLIGSIAWIANDCEFIDSWGCGSEEAGVMVVGTLGLALVGTGLGAGLGALIKSDKWEEVPLSRLRVAPVAMRNGQLGLAVSVAF